MQLTYRGITYTPNSTPIEAPKAPIVGTYRGQHVSFSTPQPADPINAELTYRGNSYNPCFGQSVTNRRQSIQLRRTRQHPAFGG